MSREELATAFGITPSAMWKWSRRDGFPSSIGFRDDRLPSGRRPRGSAAEVWDLDDVQRWRAGWLERPAKRAEQRAAAAERGRRASAKRRRRDADRLLANIRRRRVSGASLRDIAVAVDASYTFVRAQCADISVAAVRWPRRPYRWTDEEIAAALATAGACSVGRYEQWRHEQTEGRPSSATVIARLGAWPVR